ncbi:MAG: 4Fe-4S binding protein [Deltaproteobacteria bacterium]|nr:MAG: 4Fe-4S binding protein [Deltaproteobacteria bacterium]
MSFIVTDNCQLCRYTDCVTVCPVDCFYGDETQLYINPNECINCGACEIECPVNAIFEESMLPLDKKYWSKVNAEKSIICQNITTRQEPHIEADLNKKKLGF